VSTRPISRLRRLGLLLALSSRTGVGHPPQPLADVRSADARRAKIGRPDCISHSFQVSPNSVEPVSAKRARNLFSKNDWRTALRDEAVELGPQVPLVVGAKSATGDAEGLAGTASSPDGAVVCPASGAQGMGPDADTGKEMGLSEPGDV
jgi:hypothetical protein